jgi:hypothetical protein
MKLKIAGIQKFSVTPQAAYVFFVRSRDFLKINNSIFCQAIATAPTNFKVVFYLRITVRAKFHAIFVLKNLYFSGSNEWLELAA